ncbi:ParB/RepB/Spo0J family partition protein [Streptomyces sp. NPDC059193]|uniref:ParB/RepB/Spo0J family partition protein n=1 Tax=Streptomyces sp. NPDC059193 TaxID=3346763 RepID=UPI0036956395
MSKRDLVRRYTSTETDAVGVSRNDILTHYGIGGADSKENAREREMREWEEAQQRRLSGPLPTDPPRSVPLAALAHNPLNPREELTELAEQAESFRQRGQLQPLAVVSREAFLGVHSDLADRIGDARFVVIDGNRRLAAAHEAGLTELRIDVNDDLAATAADMLESALVANVQRVDVEPMAQAKALQELMEVHGSQRALAKRLGKSNAWVSQRLTLLSLPDDMQMQVESGQLPVRDARRIGGLPAAEQRPQAEAAIARAAAPRRKPQTKETLERVPATTTNEVSSQTPASTETAPEPAKGVEPAAPLANEVRIPSQVVPGPGDPIWQDVDGLVELLRERMEHPNLVQLTIRLAEGNREILASNRQ